MLNVKCMCWCLSIIEGLKVCEMSYLISLKEKPIPTILWLLLISTTTWWWQYKSAKTFCSKYNNCMIFIVLYYSGNVISINLAKNGKMKPKLYGNVILKYVSNIQLWDSEVLSGLENCQPPTLKFIKLI